MRGSTVYTYHIYSFTSCVYKRILTFISSAISWVYMRVLTRVQLTSSCEPSSNPGLSQSGLQSRLGVFTLEANLG